MTDLAHRILFSSGGAILVTGYRGVGKTSFVNRAVEVAGELLPQLSGQTAYEDLLYIQFNLARQMSPDEIMHHIIRRTYQALIDHHLMPKLSKDTQRLVDLAYKRTALSISQKTGAARSTQAGASLPEIGVPGAPISFSVQRGWSRSDEESLTFLSYDDKTAEFDVIQLLHHLVRGQQNGRRKPIKVVIAFDELDKINTYVQQENKLVPNPYLDQVVAALKSVLTTSGVVFVFIAGRDFYQRWQSDLRHTDSIYDSVFAHQVYLSCKWDFPKDLIRTYQTDSALTQEQTSQVLAGYLRFHSRGITRRAYRSINQMIQWERGKPYLVLDEARQKRLQFYYDLDALLNRHEPQILSPIRERTNIALYQDEYRSYTYRLVDTIIESAGRDFTGIDLLKIGREEIPLLSEYELANLTHIVLDILLDNHYIHRMGSQRSGFAGPLATESGKATTVAHQRYRLSDSILVKINDLDLQEDQDHVILGVLGNYDLIEKIGEGGFTEVYKARDRRTINQVVVIKQAKSYYAGDISPVATLRNEARLLTKLAEEDHGQIVALYEDKSETEPAYLALEHIDGINLKEALALVKSFGLEEILAFIPILAAPVSLLHELEIFQLDIKPANFILTRQGTVCLIDLGSALDFSVGGQQKGVGLRVGTLEYAAPELKEGQIESLELADVYSFGVMIYELLLGSLPSDSALAEIRRRLPEMTDSPTSSDDPNQKTDRLQINQGRLRRLIINYFNEGELRDLCFDMGIDYEGLPGTGKWDKTRELVDYTLRADRLSELLAVLSQQRPKVSWDITEEKADHQAAFVREVVSPGFQRPTRSRATQKLSELEAQDGHGSILDVLAQALAINPQQRFSSISELAGTAQAKSPTASLVSPLSIAQRVFNLQKGFLQEEYHPTMLLSGFLPSLVFSPEGQTQRVGADPAGVGSASNSDPSFAPRPETWQSLHQVNANFTSRLSTSGLVEPSATDSFKLISRQTRRVHLLDSERITVGRLLSNDIVLNHSSVSRKHALFEYRHPGQWVVVNLQSSNGTFVNGRRLDSALPLEQGDVVTIGQFDFVFSNQEYHEGDLISSPTEIGADGAFRPGAVFNNRYEIMKLLGRGGMSLVYQAMDMGSQNRVAIKQLVAPRFLSENDALEVRRSFHNEVQLLEQLSHPNIVQLFDHFYAGSDYFYVMEYVDGQTVESLMHNSSQNILPEALVLGWVEQICDALTYLHSQSIIYRDIKPANIIITGNNLVKLLDFGTARYFKTGKRTDTAKIGTPGYAAPEQYGSQQTDPASDVYALGSTMHHMLTGQSPDSRPSPFDILPAREINPRISNRTSEAIAKATNSDRSKRFQSAAEFWEALKPKN